MADINLTQVDADVLIAMEKHRATDEQTDFPVGGNPKSCRFSPPTNENDSCST